MSYELSQADRTHLSAGQQQEIQALKRAWHEASAAGDKAAMARANQQAEQIRAQAGYAGGSDGSGYTKLDQEGRPAAVPGAGQNAAQVQKWVDDYEYLNYSDRDGWVNGFSTEMNLRSMANYIRQQMDANSRAWAGADREGQAYLHDQNRQLAKILEKAVGGAESIFNEEKGRWETYDANLGYGYNVGQYNDPHWYKDFYGMTDEQMEAYRSDTDRYRNFVDQRVIRNWVDDSSGYTGLYSQFVNGPYGQLLKGTNYVHPHIYEDVQGDGFHDETDYKRPGSDENGVVIPRPPALKNNNNLTDYTRQFTSYVDENGIIQPGILIQSHPGGGHKPGYKGEVGHGVSYRPAPEGIGPGAIQGNDMLDQWQEAAKNQAVHNRDHAVDKAVSQLLQAQKEAQSRYQDERDQIARDERNALDNSALYAETRGDRGGIGQTQYDQIQAAASSNRQLVNSAQSQLAADTARQIAQLRAEGEFRKADDLLEISQTYLLKLLDLEKWAGEFGLEQDKFRERIRQWEKEYSLKVAKMLI